MPMLTYAAHDLMLDALDGTLDIRGIGMLSLHSAYSSIGANELVGGLPPYARQPAVGWLPSSFGSKLLAATLTFDVPANSTVAWVGCWSTEVVPTFLGMSPIGGSVLLPFVVENAPTTIVQSVGHPLVVGDSVVIWTNTNIAQPAGLFEGAQYYVFSTTTDTLELSLFPIVVGVVMSFPTSGSGYLQQFSPQIFSVQDQYLLTSFSLENVI